MRGSAAAQEGEPQAEMEDAPGAAPTEPAVRHLRLPCAVPPPCPACAEDPPQLLSPRPPASPRL